MRTFVATSQPRMVAFLDQISVGPCRRLFARACDDMRSDQSDLKLRAMRVVRGFTPASPHNGAVRCVGRLHGNCRQASSARRPQGIGQAQPTAIIEGPAPRSRIDLFGSTAHVLAVGSWRCRRPILSVLQTADEEHARAAAATRGIPRMDVSDDLALIAELTDEAVAGAIDEVRELPPMAQRHCLVFKTPVREARMVLELLRKHRDQYCGGGS